MRDRVSIRDRISLRDSNTPVTRLTCQHGKQEATRADDIARYLPLWPRELNDESLAGRKRLVALIEQALRKERRRGRAGHSAYDLARHAALYRALKRQRTVVARLDLDLRKKQTMRIASTSART